MKILIIPLIKSHIKIFNSIVNAMLQNEQQLELSILLPDEFIDISATEIKNNLSIKRYELITLSKLKLKNLTHLIKEIYPNVILLCNDQPVIMKSIIFSAQKLGIPIVLIQDGVLGFQKVSLANFIHRRIKYLFKISKYYKMYSYLLFTAGFMFTIRDILKRFFTRNVHWIGETDNIHFVVMGNYYLENYKKIMKNKIKIYVTGSPLFDHLFSIKNIKKSSNRTLDSCSKILVVSQSFVEYGYWTLKKWLRFMKEIIQTVNEFDNSILKIRPHPAENLKKYELLKKFGDFLISSQDEDLNMEILSSEIIITYNSTVLFNTIVMDKQFIIYNFDKSKLYIPYDRFFPDALAYSKAELKNKLNSMIFKKSSVKLPDENKELFIKKFLYKIDGLSSKRIANLILGLFQ